MIEWRRRCFLPSFLAETLFTFRIVLNKPTARDRKPRSKWHGHFDLSGLLTLYNTARNSYENANAG